MKFKDMLWTLAKDRVFSTGGMGGGGIVHHSSKKIAHSPLHQILFLFLPHQKSIPPSLNINVQVMTQ